MEAYCKCNKCGKDVKVDTSMVLTSNPPQYKYDCPHCGNISYVQTAAVYSTPASKSISNSSNLTNLSGNAGYYLNAVKEDCTSCSHSIVCKYKEDFMKKLASIDLSSESFIRMRCECIHYQQQQYNYREITWLNGSNPLDKMVEYNRDDCSNCDFMKKLITDGTYIGDSPCEWCGKNPYKLTCTAGTAVNTISQKKTIINEVLDTCCTAEEKKDV